MLIELSEEPLAPEHAVVACAKNPVPWHCRWRLWHSWARYHVHGGTPYVACAHCGHMSTPTVFDRPWAS